MANVEQITPRRNGHGIGELIEAFKENGHAVPPVTGNGWDRPPQPVLAKRVAAARRQRAKALAAARRILGRRTLGNDERITERLRQAHALYEQYREAGVTIVESELL